MISLTEIAIITSNYLVLSKFYHYSTFCKYHSLQILYLEIQECCFVNCATDLKVIVLQYYLTCGVQR